MRALLVALVACGGGAAPVTNHQPAPGGVPSLPGGGDRAYVADGTGLVEVARSGAQVLAPGDVRWCAVDARARVVWLSTDHGLATFDLDDRRIHPVIARDLSVRDTEDVQIGNLAVIIDWGEQKLGGESRVDFDVGISIAMTDHPHITEERGCDGDRYVYCFDEQHQPSKSVVALQAHVKELALADPAYVAELARRGAQRTLWSRLPPARPEPTPPAIDKQRCHEIPDQCGMLTAVPGQPLWLVVTDNSRGDYFHQTRELWDPATHEFVRIVDGALIRATQVPPSDGASGDYTGLRVSPSGMSSGGLVFDATRVLYRPKEYGHTCGWASGGWRMAGPGE